MKDINTSDIQRWKTEEGTEFEFSMNRLNAVRQSITNDYEKQLAIKEGLLREFESDKAKCAEVMSDYKALIQEWHIVDEDEDFVTSLYDSKYADAYYDFDGCLVMIKSEEDDETFTILNG